MNRQIRWFGVVLLVLFLALFVQLNYLQVVSADRLNHHPGNVRTAIRDFSQPRGPIQSADGAVLATSVPSNDQYKHQRTYPEGQLFGQITGYLSFTYGTEGVERTYNGVLTGRKQKFRVSRLADLLLEKERTATVTLTLSKQVQQVAAQALGSRKGAVVALDVHDGSVLAMYSWPSFDPTPLAAHDQRTVQNAWTLFNLDGNKPLLPRAYRERYFPGSTFKVVTAATALTDNVDVNTTFPQLTELPLPNTVGQTLRNFGGERCGGDLPAVLRVSCNTAFAQLGLDIGAVKLSAGADAFGFNQRPPLDLPSVASSQFPDASAFTRDKPALAKSAIGQQDVQATPLQMALIASAIANQGVAMVPHVMAEVRDTEGQVVQRWQPRQWVRAVSPEVAGTLRDMMVGVVTGGTATRAAIPGIPVAAKTGTAQTAVPNTSHAWLIAFAPADNPKVAVAVIVESQPGNTEATGGVVAAPIAQAVLRAALGAP